ncbi:hypothetical protein BBJ28_00001503 [Nothophytophthora sp. Chile5]|nr:hypothetical protein BBJ28_00001503 [Nothophytophthora sp. Chile5]
MSQLTFLHFGVHPRLRSLPSWEGLGNLKSITLVMLMSLKELPPFDGVPNLERFLLAVVPLIDSVPDMTPLRHLKAFFTIDRGAMCCNGFLDNVCNLTHFTCIVHPMWKMLAAACLPANRTATPVTLAFFRAFSSVCANQAVRSGVMPSPPNEVNMRECNGTLFRQCTVPASNLTGMCYNSTMNAIACNVNPYETVMRCRQIEEGVGDPCDPAVEAWLGNT